MSSPLGSAGPSGMVEPVLALPGGWIWPSNAPPSFANSRFLAAALRTDAGVRPGLT